MDAIRVVTSDGIAVKLQTAVTKFSFAAGMGPEFTVDFVGSTHIGELEYYASLNAILNTYDAVFFEGVLSEAKIASRSFKCEQGVAGNIGRPGFRQEQELADLAGLVQQMERLNLNGHRFIHADVSTEELHRNLAKIGFSSVDEFFKSQIAASRGHAIFNPLLEAICKWPDQRKLEDAIPTGELLREIRRALCRAIFDAATYRYSSEAYMEVVLRRRDNIVLSKITKFFIGADQSKPLRVAVCYGAGHYGGISAGLLQQLGMMPSGEPQWLTAIDASETVTPSEDHLRLVFELLR